MLSFLCFWEGGWEKERRLCVSLVFQPKSISFLISNDVYFQVFPFFFPSDFQEAISSFWEHFSSS